MLNVGVVFLRRVRVISEPGLYCMSTLILGVSGWKDPGRLSLHPESELGHEGEESQVHIHPDRPQEQTQLVLKGEPCGDSSYFAIW